MIKRFIKKIFSFLLEEDDEQMDLNQLMMVYCCYICEQGK